MRALLEAFLHDPQAPHVSALVMGIDCERASGVYSQTYASEVDRLVTARETLSSLTALAFGLVPSFFDDEENSILLGPTNFAPLFDAYPQLELLFD
jgi:hypothetical protein